MAPVRAALLAASWALSAATDVYVMLPLDTVKSDGTLKDKGGLSGQLDKLKQANVDGFMVDVWWGLTEQSPRKYNFGSTKEIVRMAKDHGMRVQLVASFHQCGGNTGDTCNIPLPAFIQSQKDIWYKDQTGNEAHEYISLFADNITIEGRNPVQMYADWFAALADTFKEEMGGTIKEVQVSMGPAGELRYPGYQLSHWQFAASAPPGDAGSYNDRPDGPSFWRGGYQSEYGKFFLDWYFSSLKNHGKAVLAAAKAAFGGKVGIAGKISGIHWWYKDQTHAAEVTAGYYNTNNRDAYSELAKEVFAPNGAAVDFTCLEMRDTEQSSSCGSGPQELVQKVASSAKAAGVPFSGENALPRYDTTAFGQIESYRSFLTHFTYLRLCNDLLQDNNFNNFKDFVNRMHNSETPIQV
eukprot:CAMPEP_0171172796 /NCGR_PEP_ID=MMETSP0790-20130122/9899_1 /TAXON_ID=2925 /ORGANISM="Alexandrium catenella, Strain OF101" /LENGTH=409 /DNA_ID=CAMNT_0011637655 /DNA_START=72 /DNA_END=1302 /DNA_ORIENTATION=+